LPPGHNPGIPEMSNSVNPPAQAEVYPKKMIPSSSAPEYKQFSFDRLGKFLGEKGQGKNIPLFFILCTTYFEFLKFLLSKKHPPHPNPPPRGGRGGRG